MRSEKRVLHWIAQDRHWTLEIGGPGGGLIGDWRLVREDWRLESGRQEVFFIRGAESRTAGACQSLGYLEIARASVLALELWSVQSESPTAVFARLSILLGT